MLAFLKRFWKDEDGQGMVEYGLILGLVAVVAIIALTGIGAQVVAKLNDVWTALGGNPPA